MPEPQQQVPFRALCKLLPDLINGSALVAATTIGFLPSRLGQLEDSEAVLGLLKGVAPALRCAIHILCAYQRLCVFLVMLLTCRDWFLAYFMAADNCHYEP